MFSLCLDGFSPGMKNMFRSIRDSKLLLDLSLMNGVSMIYSLIALETLTTQLRYKIGNIMNGWS